MGFHLPDKDHPAWKLLQSLIGLLALIIWVSNENNGVATHEAVGMGGAALMGSLAGQIFHK